MSEQEQEKIPLGFKATKQQRDELQKWAEYFYNQHFRALYDD